MHRGGFQILQHPWTERRQCAPLSGEQRVMIAALLTAGAMCFEIIAGWLTGSMTLLAGALHSASNCTALGIAACAYRLAREQPVDRRSSSLSFGAGKAGALGSFAGSILLLALAAALAIQSALLLMTPAPVRFNQAITVAVVVLLINGLSVCVLSGAYDPSARTVRTEGDRNLKNAFLNVFSDSLMSVATLAVLVSASVFSLAWADPMAGFLGGIFIARWTWGFLKATAGVLLDHQVPKDVTDEIVKRIEEDGTAQIADLQVWSVGPALHSASVMLLSEHPRSVQYYKQLVTKDLPIVYSNVEVFQLSGKKRRNLRLIRPPIESLSFGSTTPAFLTS